MLVFRAISREKTRKDRRRVGTSTGRRGRKRAFLGRLDEEKRRGVEVEKALEPCWKLLKSTRARDRRGGTRGKDERRRGSYK